MSGYRPRLSHGPSCICTLCQRRRRKERREAERPRRRPAEEVSAILLEARKRGMTYREIADVAGLSIGTIHRICRGGVKVDPATQDRIAELEIV